MACSNPGLIAAISTTLAGPLLDLAGIDTLGINLHAWTSRGKTGVLEAAQSCIGGAEHLVIPGRNHMWPDEDPQGFVDAVLRFIQANDAD